MSTTIIESMKTGVPVSRRTLARMLGYTRKHTNWIIKNLLETEKIRRVQPSEVGSGKCSFSEYSLSDDSSKKKKDKKNDKKKSYEKRRTREFNVFVLV
jgi:hypothetical protein